MTTSISSEAIEKKNRKLKNEITDGQNIYRVDAHLWGESAQKEIGAISQLGAEKITFPPKPERHTYIQTDIQTDGHLVL